MADRDAKCIDVLQAQIKAAYPGRDTDSDGTIAGAAHHLANPTSDHEADSRGIVHAVDLTHDLSVGFDSHKWADYMAGLAPNAPPPDARIKYIISNSRIWNPSINAGLSWRPYNGPNPHDHHVHVSINKVGEDDTRPWNIGPVPISAAVPDAPRPRNLLKRGSEGPAVRELQRLLGMIDADGVFGPKTEVSVKTFQVSRGLTADGKVGAYTWQALLLEAPAVEQPAQPAPQPSANRLKMAQMIVNFEARRDKAGHLVVYHPPANDGGGSYEVAGLNEKYDKPIADKVIALLKAGKFDQAEAMAVWAIADNTDAAALWTTRPAVECYLRDCVFNRGARGAARILQRALGIKDDGVIGPVTKNAEARATPGELLLDLRAARESYERKVVGYRANFWKGLVSRWDNALKVAQTFL